MKLVSLLIFLVLPEVFAANLSGPVSFTGTCDASGVYGLSGDLFLVANDEDSVLRIYRFSQPGPPVQSIDLKPLLTRKSKLSEMDLEAVAPLGTNVWFITSHGQNASGKSASSRHRLFALHFEPTNSVTAATLVGEDYTSLVADLARDPRYQAFDLANAAALPPKAPGGFNIEALAATPAGELLIGFRSPIPAGQALVAPLLNPNEVLAGQPPVFGAPLRLDLGGLGLRDMTRTAQGYFLVAGAPSGKGGSKLYFWSGGDSAPRLLPEIEFRKSNPEGICPLEFGTAHDYLIVSDDGTRKIDGQECKTLPEAQRRFRAYRFTP